MGVLSTATPDLSRWVALLLLALGHFACTVEAPGDLEFGPQDVGTGADVGLEGDLERQARIVPSLEGTWLVFSQLSTCVTLVNTEEGITRTLFIVEAEHDEATGFVDETWQACMHELPVVLNLPTFGSQGLLDGSYPVTSRDGFVSGTRVGGGYVSGHLPELWGYQTDDPLRDPFPTETDDPRIRDTDDDGNPGVSLRAGDQCDTYLIQRTISTLQGAFVAPDRIEGGSVSFTEQLVLGGSSSFCAARFDSRSNDGRNVFERVRIDGRGDSLDLDRDGDGVITCAEVLPVVDDLFTRITPDHAHCQ